MNTVTILGCGNLGKSLIKSILNNGVRNSIKASVKTRESLYYLSNNYVSTSMNQFIFGTNNSILIKDIKHIFLTIKPSEIDNILSQIKDNLKDDQIIISMVAGISVEYIRKRLNVNQKIVRCMSSLSIENGTSIVGIYGNLTNEEYKDISELYFKGCSLVRLKKEKQIDAITVISGCGTAFISYFAKQFYDTAKSYGFDEVISKKLVNTTFQGTSKILESEDYEVLIKRVMSKGGATEKGILHMDEEHINLKIKEALDKSYIKVLQIKKSEE